MSVWIPPYKVRERDLTALYRIKHDSRTYDPSTQAAAEQEIDRRKVENIAAAVRGEGPRYV